MPRRAWMLGSLLVGTALLAPPVGMMGPGIGPALAAPAARAKKRVEGRGTKSKVAATGARPAAQPAASASFAAGRGRTRVVFTPKATETPSARRVKFSAKKGLARARYSSLPRYRPRVVLRPTATPGREGAEPKAAVSPPIAAPAAIAQGSPPAGAPRAAEAVPTSGTALPPDRVIATASITPAATVHPTAERMRSALEARARSMASELGIVSLPLPAPAPPPQLSARSVTFDLQKGLRTIVFEDGATVTAPFDPARAESATGLPAAK